MPVVSLSFVAAVVLFAAKTSMYARAVEFCPVGSNPQYIHAVTTAGADDQALSCTIGQAGTPAVLSINLRDVPVGPGDASTVRFQGTVNPLSAIIVRFPSVAQAENSIPLSVTISNTQFGEGSGLQITGSLPPSSTLLISGNSFSVSTAQQPTWFINTFSAIALFPESDDTSQELNDGSQVTIADNTITGSGDLETFNAAVGISWRGGVNYGSGAGVQIVRNSITLACQSALNPSVDQQACVVGVHLLANQFFNGFAGSLVVDANAFAITGGLLAAMPPVASVSQIGTLVSFSDNVCQATTTGAVGPDAVTFGYLSFGSDAQYAIRNNSITLTGTTACGLGFSRKIPVDQMWDGGQDPPTALTDTAALTFAANTIVTSGCEAQVRFARDHQLAGTSRFVINANSVTRQDQADSAVAIQVLNGIALLDGAVMSIGGNAWSGPSGVPSAQLISYGLSLSASVTGPLGSVRACGNSLFGAALTTEAEVRGRCPDGMSTVVTASECVVDVTEDTLQNTFATTTAAATTLTSGTTADAPLTTTLSQTAGPTGPIGTLSTVTDAPIETTTTPSTTTPDFVNNTVIPTTGQPSSCDATANRVAFFMVLLVAFATQGV